MHPMIKSITFVPSADHERDMFNFAVKSEVRRLSAELKVVREKGDTRGEEVTLARMRFLNGSLL